MSKSNPDRLSKTRKALIERAGRVTIGGVVWTRAEIAGVSKDHPEFAKILESKLRDGTALDIALKQSLNEVGVPTTMASGEGIKAALSATTAGNTGTVRRNKVAKRSTAATAPISPEFAAAAKNAPKSLKGKKASQQAVRMGMTSSAKGVFGVIKKAVGEETYKRLKPMQKWELIKQVLPDVKGAEAVGVVRDIGSKLLALGGGDTPEMRAALNEWGSAHGVARAADEALAAKDGKSQGLTGKQVAQIQTRGVEGGVAKTVAPTVADRTERRAAAGGEKLAGIAKAAAEKQAATTADALKKDKRSGMEGAKGPAGPGLPKGAVQKVITTTTTKKTGAFNEDGTPKYDPASGDRVMESKPVPKKVKVWYNPATKMYLTNLGYGNWRESKKAEVVANEGVSLPTGKTTKPLGEKSAFKESMTTLSKQGGRQNTEWTIESIKAGHSAMNAAIKAENEQLKAAGKEPKPYVGVKNFIQQVFPDVDKREISSMAVKVKNQRKAEGVGRKPAKVKKAGVTLLEPQSVETGRKILNTKERKRDIAMRTPSGPEQKPPTKREKAAADAAMKAGIAGKPMEPGKVVGGRKRTFKPAQKTGPETMLDALKKDLDSGERRKLMEIGRMRESFKPGRVKKAVNAGVFGDVSPATRKAAKAAGYINIALLALRHLGDDTKKKP